jgi:hypothetical protein
MLELNYNKFLNEGVGDVSIRKLRDAMHDIIVELEPKETIDVEELSKTLMDEFKINISPFFLDKFLDDFLKVKKGDKKAITFFTRSDTRWLGVREIKGSKQIRNNLPHIRPSLAKHKRRLFIEEDKKRLDDAYKSGMKDLNFSEDIIRSSLVLQKPADSEDMMKFIYSEVIINKKYENNYDNCWKLMMLLSRSWNLDRIRGWFKLAPQSVKDEFYSAPEGKRKINYDLTKPKPKKVLVKKDNLKRDLDITPETKENLMIVDHYLHKYKKWADFISDTTLRDLINIIDNLKPGIKFIQQSKDYSLFHEFLAKIDQLNLILIKHYKVNKKDVLLFFMKIKLASFLREWEAMKSRPKINDF